MYRTNEMEGKMKSKKGHDTKKDLFTFMANKRWKENCQRNENKIQCSETIKDFDSIINNTKNNINNYFINTF